MLNGLNPASKQAIGNILSGYGNTELQLTTEQQKNTIHIIYALGCEYVGTPPCHRQAVFPGFQVCRRITWSHWWKTEKVVI